MPRGPEKVEGMTKPKRARKRKRETSQGGPEATTCSSSEGRVSHREMGSEGHVEKYRAVIDGGYLDDEPVGQRWGKVEPALRRLSINLCLKVGSSSLLKARLKHGIELSESRSDGPGDSSPSAVIQGRDSQSEFELQGIFGMKVSATVTAHDFKL